MSTSTDFSVPVNMTYELCYFLNVPIDTKESRVVVTRKVNEYITANKLQRPENHKIIKPNKVLKDLLRLEDGAEFCYFDMQKHLDHLFVATTIAV